LKAGHMKFREFLKMIPLQRFRDPAPVVPVVRLSGVIGASSRTAIRGRTLSLDGLSRSLERAFDMPNSKAVALAINSPGGAPAQSSLIAKRIRDLSAKKQLPVIAFTEDVAASGGYWLACAADEIWADETSMIGSIGVISAGFGLQDFIARHGIERRIHTAGDRKNLLDPFVAEQANDIDRLTAMQSDIHERFISYVKERRGDRLKEDAGNLFSGEFWTGTSAAELGLIDGIGEIRAVLRDKFGERVKLVPVRDRQGIFGGRLGVRSSATVATTSLERAAIAAAPDALMSIVDAIEERAIWHRFGL